MRLTDVSLPQKLGDLTDVSQYWFVGHVPVAELGEVNP